MNKLPPNINSLLKIASEALNKQKLNGHIIADKINGQKKR